MKKLFYENRVLFVLITLIIISLIIIIGGLFIYFFNGNGKSVYGNRLNDIEKYTISKDIETKLNDLYKDTAVDSVKYDLKGKVIYIIIDLKENAALVDAQTLALKSLEVFTVEEMGYYDIQLMVTATKLEEKSELYPILGYKNAKNAQVVWTNTKVGE